LGGKDFLSFAQFVTSIARISEELVLRENLVATMSERLHFFCQHLETTVRSKQQWVKLQDFTKRLAFTKKILLGKKGVDDKEGSSKKKQRDHHRKGSHKHHKKQQHHHHHHHHHRLKK
jgi:hypothetical protein